MEQSFIEYSLGKDASSAVLWVYPVRKPRGKAIIMCPGGGFNQIASDHEGRDFAAWFNNQGITYAVLNYRMPHGDVEVIREDIPEAIRLIRRQSAEWGIHQLGVMGASIGGYIAATAATLYIGTRERMLGETISEGLKETLSLELHVTADTPRTFIVLAEDDQAVSPLNSIVYYTALLKHGVSAGLHIYPEGGHSFGFRDSFIYKKLWTDELQKWLLTF